MPTYEYACTACGHRLEAVQKFSDKPLKKCPECGKALRKVYGAVGIVLKGSGFYKTDSRSTASAGAGSSSSGSDSSSSDSGSGSGSGSGGSDSSKDSGSKTEKTSSTSDAASKPKTESAKPAASTAS